MSYREVARERICRSALLLQSWFIYSKVIVYTYRIFRNFTYILCHMYSREETRHTCELNEMYASMVIDMAVKTRETKKKSGTQQTQRRFCNVVETFRKCFGNVTILCYCCVILSILFSPLSQRTQITLF